MAKRFLPEQESHLRCLSPRTRSDPGNRPQQRRSTSESDDRQSALRSSRGGSSAPLPARVSWERGIGDARSKLTFYRGVRRTASRAGSASPATIGSHSFPKSGESTRSISGGSEGDPKGEICLTSYRRIFAKSHGARFGRRRPPPLWVKGRPPLLGCPGPGPSGLGPPAPGWRWRRRYGRLRDRV